MRVLYVQYTSPGLYPPIVRGAQLLAESGAEVRMLGTRVPDAEALEAFEAPGVEVRLMRAAPPGWRLKAHYARYAAWVIREAAAWRPDWLYASDLFSTPIALTLARLAGVRVLYHEHDAPAAGRTGWVTHTCLTARRRLTRSADLVVAPNAERAANLSRVAGGRPVLTVWNCPRRPVDRRPARAPASGRPVRVIFRGSINRDRVPLSLIEALALAEHPVLLDIAGYETVGSRGYVATLSSTAGSLGVADRVRVRGLVREADFAALCAESDLGVGFMPVGAVDENMRHMTGASNKVFEYLAHGVVPLVSDLPDWRSTFVDPGYAIACDPRDARGIASLFEWARTHRDELGAIGARGRARIDSDWNYETQFAPVLDALWHRTTLGNGVAPPSHAGAAQCAS